MGNLLEIMLSKYNNSKLLVILILMAHQVILPTQIAQGVSAVFKVYVIAMNLT